MITLRRIQYSLHTTIEVAVALFFFGFIQLTFAGGTLDISVNEPVNLGWDTNNVTLCSVTVTGYADGSIPAYNQFQDNRPYAPNYFSVGSGKSARVRCYSATYEGYLIDDAYLVVHPLPADNLQYQCNVPSPSTATMTWNTPSGGADSYYIEVTGASSCPSGWISAGGGRCTRTVIGNSTTFLTESGVTYNWTIQSRVGVVQSLTNATGASFSCNNPPVANAGIDQLITQPTSASAPAGAMAYDAEGPVTILWTSTVRPTGAGPVEIRRETTLTPTFASLSTIGTYVFTLTVTDTDGLVSTDSMNVVVQAEGTPTGPTGTPGPTGDIWADGTSGSITIPTGGSATITWDSDDTTNCRIMEGSSQIATGPSNSTGISVTPAAPTLYSLICDGTNGALNVLIDVVSINVANNLPPNISANRRIVPEGDGVNLTWNLNGGTGPCVLTANNISIPGYLNIVMNGSYAVPSVNVTTTYEIQCPSGSDSVRVEIIPRGFET